MNCRCITLLEGWAIGFGPESLIIGIFVGYWARKVLEYLWERNR